MSPNYILDSTIIKVKRHADSTSNFGHAEITINHKVTFDYQKVSLKIDSIKIIVTLKDHFIKKYKFKFADGIDNI